MNAITLRLIALCFVSLLFMGAAASERWQTRARSDELDRPQVKADAIKLQYVEIVTPSVDETCKALADVQGVTFREPIAELGNARTADLSDGGRIGVRAPMRDTEQPVVRLYILVDDIRAAVQAAEKAGATVAIPPMKIPGQGTFSIYTLGGIEHGLWQH